MQDFVLIAALVKLVTFLVAVFALWAVLRKLDHMAGVSFSRDVMAKMKEDPDALARYFGLRLVAMAILGLGFLFS